MSKLVRLVSHEGELFEAPREVEAMRTEQVELADLGVDSDALSQVLRYCEIHRYVPPEPQPRANSASVSMAISDPEDLRFLQALDSDRLLKVLTAAHALDVKSLKDLICAYLAVEIGGKDLLEMQSEFEEQLVVEEREEDWMREQYLSKK